MKVGTIGHLDSVFGAAENRGGMMLTEIELDTLNQITQSLNADYFGVSFRLVEINRTVYIYPEFAESENSSTGWRTITVDKNFSDFCDHLDLVAKVFLDDAMREETCEWRIICATSSTTVYETKCGKTFRLENNANFVFCKDCGRKIEVV
jgi:DNA-directed RNA polymerase subunit RPC12/RpoP